MEIKIGDFCIGNDGHVYEITNISKQGLDSFYELKVLTEPGDFILDGEKIDIDFETTIVLARNELRHLGRLIPKEESEKVIEILFKEKLT